MLKVVGMNKYAQLIQDVEAKCNVRLGFISDTTLSLSSSGYIIQDHMDAEKIILQSKLFKYDTKVLQQFDKLCGVTYTHFIKKVG